MVVKDSVSLLDSQGSFFFFVFFLFSHSLSLSHTHTAPVNLWESVIYFNNGLILTGFSPRINCISPSLKAAGENHNVALFPKQNPADSSPSGGCLLEGLSACSSSKDFSLESLFLFVPFLCDSLNSCCYRADVVLLNEQL